MTGIFAIYQWPEPLKIALIVLFVSGAVGCGGRVDRGTGNEAGQGGRAPSGGADEASGGSGGTAGNQAGIPSSACAAAKPLVALKEGGTYGSTDENKYTVLDIDVQGAPEGSYSLVKGPNDGDYSWSVILCEGKNAVAQASYPWHTTVGAGKTYTFSFPGYLSLRVDNGTTGTKNLYATPKSLFNGKHFVDLTGNETDNSAGGASASSAGGPSAAGAGGATVAGAGGSSTAGGAGTSGASNPLECGGLAPAACFGCCGGLYPDGFGLLMLQFCSDSCAGVCTGASPGTSDACAACIAPLYQPGGACLKFGPYQSECLDVWGIWGTNGSAPCAHLGQCISQCDG